MSGVDTSPPHSNWSLKNTEAAMYCNNFSDYDSTPSDLTITDVSGPNSNTLILPRVTPTVSDAAISIMPPSSTPTNNRHERFLEQPELYDIYLARLNPKSTFSKTLLNANKVKLDNTSSTATEDYRSFTSDQGPGGGTNSSTKPSSCEALDQLHQERQPRFINTCDAPAQIRERYSEKAKERRLRAYEKAIILSEKREKEEGRIHRARRVIDFKLKFQTYFGQEVWVVGSISQLGSWDPSKALPLVWTAGNIWTCTVTLSLDDGIVEYKYILRDSNTGKVDWEPGYNHTVNISQFKTINNSVNDNWGAGNK